MAGSSPDSVFAPSPSLLAAADGAMNGAGGSIISPVMILVLCVVAGVGTLLLLPSRREGVIRRIGGIILLAAGLIFAALLIRHVRGLKMGGMSVYFWLFSVIAIVGAIRVITHPRPVYSALYFVLTVLASAGLFILLWAEFMAAALVIVYAGAILVTYVFVIMLASQSSPSDDGGEAGLADYDRVSREPLVACAVGFAMMGVLLFVIFEKSAQAPGTVASAALTAPTMAPPGGPAAWTVQGLGTYLFTNQLVNLELAGLILTISMVGAIVIARRRVVDVEDRAGTAGRKEVMVAPATPIDDNPHSIPVYGTVNPRAKAYPEA
jgi:NADH-quinone oxidoreductase subunit J